jgi:hypothetical protein
MTCGTTCVVRTDALLAILVVSATIGDGCAKLSSDQPSPDGSAGPANDAATQDAPAPDAGGIADVTTVDWHALDAGPGDVSDAGVVVSLDAPVVDANWIADVTTVDWRVVDSGPVSDAGVVVIPDGSVGSVTSLPGLPPASIFGGVRSGHTATLLSNGHVLICGGRVSLSGLLSSCDDFDPSTNMATSGPSMVTGRAGHTATLLPNGQVLIAGGEGYFDKLESAEIYDPASNSFALVSNPIFDRTGAAAVLGVGPNAGKVFFLGGPGSVDGGAGTNDSVEVFDPGSVPGGGSFVLLPAHMSVGRSGATAATLPDGALLVAGGSSGQDSYLSSAQTLDPALSAFADTSNSMSIGRAGAKSVTLPDGRVFVFDGDAAFSGAAAFGNGRADIYDPATRTFKATAPLPTPRSHVALALLKSGRVMIAGGWTAASSLVNEAVGDVVVYDPSTDTFLPTTGTLNPPRLDATATTLNDGRVLITGGGIPAGEGSNAVDIFAE